MSLSHINPKTFPHLHLVCASDDLRPAMEHVYLGPEHFCAVDGQVAVFGRTSDILSEAAVSMLPAEGLLVPKKTWSEFTKAATIEFKGLSVQVNYPKKAARTFKVHKDGDGLKFPNWKSIVPTEIKIKDQKEPTEHLGLNALNMARVQKAMGRDVISLNIRLTAAYRALLVSPEGKLVDMEILGLVMPSVVTYLDKPSADPLIS